MIVETIHALVIEDNPRDVRLIQEIVREIAVPAIHLNVATTLAEGLKRLADDRLDVLLLDMSLPDSRGIETFEQVHAARPDLATVILTGLDDDSLALQTLQHGAQDYLVKGQIDAGLLRRSVQYAIERKVAEESIRTLNAELERRVFERTRQLEAANKDLEAFAWTVAHDLRRPLRAIDGFTAMCQAAAKRRRHAEGDEEERYLARIRDACTQMDKLIDALLGLSRLTSHEMQSSDIDLRATAHDVATSLTRSDPDRHVEFLIAENLQVTGDGHLLRTVVENLFSNAWKFTRSRDVTRIEFGVEDHDEKPVYYVRDNGVGFSMECADKLFLPFQRLHRDDEFEGIGVGLASVQRVIWRHGGRIWAESTEDQGATFFFTLGYNGETRDEPQENTVGRR